MNHEFTAVRATEESHVILHRLFSSSIQTLDSIKDSIAQIFVDFFSAKSNIDLIDRR
ncbi:hypothetical protein LguiA_003135 [Lonicera macranthoides]